jgi:3-hydroxyacyl-CoA dehydrogenase/enoyl-CoA hydratase/3-hydroxybutyryl-CoA epimerase
MQAIFNKLERANVPTVAAINGVCLGGAFELALACQYRLVSSDSSTKLGAPETKLGIIPGAGGTQRLPRMIGIIPALDLILSGRQLDGKKAFKAGIANACVPKGQLLALELQMQELL